MTCNDKCIHYPVCEMKKYDFANIEECEHYKQEPKQGEWIREVIVEEPRKNKRAYARCSACGCLYNHYGVAVKHFNFCPKCGARQTTH